MGWDFIDGHSKKDVIALITKDAFAHTVKGNVLWTVQEYKGTKIIGCYLLGTSKSNTPGVKPSWGFKDLCEAVHPFYYNCPLSYLGMAPVACQEWRDKVVAYHARTKVALKVGDKVKLIPGCSVPEVVVTSVKPLRATADGKEYSLPRRLIAEVVA